MDWLLPAVLATLVGSAVLAWATGSVYLLERKTYLRCWTGAWVVSVVRYGATASSLVWGPSPALEVAQQWGALGSGLLLLHGTYRFARRRWSHRWSFVFAAVALWDLATPWTDLPFAVETGPTFGLLGLAMIATGIVIARRVDVRGAMPTVVGAVFVLWGIHRLDYPLLRPVTWFAPWGFGLAALLEQIAALSLVLLHLRRANDERDATVRLYRSLVNDSPVGIFRTSAEGEILNANPALVAMLRLPDEEAARRLVLPDDVYVDPADRERFLARARADEEGAIEIEIKRADGSTFVAAAQGRILKDEDGRPILLQGALQDVTERRRLEERVHQVERMEAIGRLAGGVAHDFNNLLTVVQSATALALEPKSSERDRRELLEDVLAAAGRGTEITRQLLSMSRTDRTEPVVLDLCAVVNESAGVLRRLVGERVRLVVEASEPCPIRADRGHLQQVLLNFAANARDAMHDGGTLRIAVRRAPASEAARRAGLPSAPCAHLEVQDEGVGMDASTRAHAFEPFFTTKAEGTGLGLATTYTAIVGMGGFIEVRSEPGEGTTFDVFVPLVLDEALEPRAGERGATIDARPAGVILVVENDPAVRRILERTLARAGHEVIAAPDAETALARIEGRTLRLLVSDVVMPGLGGIELAAQLREGRPDLEVLFVTGHAEHPTIEGVPRARLLAKPFTPSELLAEVRATLERAR